MLLISTAFCTLSWRIHITNNLIMGRYWCGYLSGARCKLFACGAADATATSSSFAPVKSRMVYLSGAGLPRLFSKKGC